MSSLWKALQMSDQISDRSGISIGYFSGFYPNPDSLGSTSTGYVKLLTEASGVSKVMIFGPKDARVPDHWNRSRIQLLPVWKPNDPLSLIRTAYRLWKERKGIDLYFFNIHLSIFGRSRVSTGIGLVTPPLIAFLTSKPTVTYMHNLVETQDLVNLGYQVGGMTKLGAHLMERLICETTVLQVPLVSQRDVAVYRLHHKVEQFVLPYAEGIYALDEALGAGAKSWGSRVATSDGPAELLLFGFWGPQKDLAGGLEIILDAMRLGARVHTRVVGTVNAHFPAYAAELARTRSQLPEGAFEFLGEIDEEQIGPIFASTDVVLLPYRATGGYSAAMNLAAAFDCDIVAYDLPSLREFAIEVRAHCEFISPGPESRRESAEKLVAVINSAREGRDRPAEARVRRGLAQEKAAQFVARLWDLVEANRRC
jgi:glycosyltransferase involved in cell wall biosynthesis